MKKIAVVSTILLLLLSTMIIGCLDTNELKTNVIEIEGKGEYSSIQNAIDNSSKGDTIYVYDGSYYETIVINKSIKLIGAGKEKPILIYNKNIDGSIIFVNSNDCKIEGFKLIFDINQSDNKLTVTGISISSSNNKILNNTILNAKYGIQMLNSEENIISYNEFKNNTDGIEAHKDYYNNISNNNFSNNTRFGLYLGYESQHNKVSYNYFYNNGEAILLSKETTFSNEISQNKFIKNNQEINECCGAEGKNTIVNNIYNK